MERLKQQNKISQIFFHTTVCALATFAATSLALANHCPFRTFFLVKETGKNWAVTGLETMVVSSKSELYAWQGAFWPPITDVQVQCHAEETSAFIPIF
jgi:hypothetical protein